MTLEEKAKWFDAAMKFGLNGSIQLVMKSKIKGEANWAIVDTLAKKVLNSNFEWEDEPEIAKRDEAFLIRSRFNFETAVSMYEQFKMFAEE
jgi:3-methyladenine DNA glycosylase AlkD